VGGDGMKARAAKSRLGINANLTSLPDLDEAGKQARSLRWERLKMARKLLPKERVARCIWSQVAHYVEMWKSKSNKPAHFRKVFTCGSRAMCPICAAKITERNKQDLQMGINAAYGLGWSVFMVTLTIQHNANEQFEKVLDELIKAISRLRGRKWWCRMEDEYQIEGSITALESTYGLDNGHHPHKHILFFTRRQMSDDDCLKFEKEIEIVYKKILTKYGRRMSKEHGVKVSAGGEFLAEYLAKFGHEPKDKWTIAHEMTKSGQKVAGLRSGKDARYTPFQLLDHASMGDIDAARAFQEYALTMKGKSQLRWGTGLREKLGLDVELSEEEVAAMNDEKDSIPFALADRGAWHKIRVIPGETCEAIRDMDFETFKNFMYDQGIYIEPDEFQITPELEELQTVKRHVGKYGKRGKPNDT
jgi:hypothetical protein